MSEKDDKLLVRKVTLNLKRKYGRTKQLSIVERDAFIPPNIEKDIKEMYLNKKKKTITATEIAAKYEIRVSTAKLLLKQYEQDGLVKLLDPTLKIKIYVPTASK